MSDDRRLIEDYLPIKAISAEASREKSIRKGHISTLHLWWARRPLVACRAAVYGALVPADQFQPKNGPEEKRASLGRANAARFIERLCQYPGHPEVIKEAERHILEAHAKRLTEETGKKVTREDIEAGRAPRPKVLDMFAGGGSIPLEALRLGCEAYALDLNPVAYIILLCTLVYPQKYSKPDPNARGMTGPPGPDGKPTWGGLAQEVRYWGEWVLKKVKAEIGDLYPLIPDPEYKKAPATADPANPGGTNPGGTGGPPVQQKLAFSRRNLPHYELSGSTYFITYRCRSGFTLNETERTVVLDNWRHWHGQRYVLHAAVIMPDHVHVLITPLPKAEGECHTLAEILHTNKSFTAHAINKAKGRTGPVWQDERFDRIVRDEEEFWEKWRYMENNPVKAGLVAQSEEYPWWYQNPSAWDESAKRPGQRPGPPDASWDEAPPGYLMPVAYLWTRTVTCKNPACGATVPLVRQTWLCKKKGRYVALKMVDQPGAKQVRFEVVEAPTEKDLGFDPAGFSKGGNATCPFCGTVAESAHVKAEGCAKRLGQQLMAVVCTRPGKQGKVYLAAGQVDQLMAATGGPAIPPPAELQARLAAICQRTGLTVPHEPIEANPRSMDTQHYGFQNWGDLFTPRQLLCLLTFAAAVREASQKLGQVISGPGGPPGQQTSLSPGQRPGPLGLEEREKVVVAYLSLALDKVAEIGNSLGRWEPVAQCTRTVFGRQALPMVWDFGESVPLATSAGNWREHLGRVIDSIELTSNSSKPAHVTRGSATKLPWPSDYFDAVITDPPYYDNVSYSNLSDFFYSWLKRTVGHVYQEHFVTSGTPKKSEIIAAFYRHGGDKHQSRLFYEQMMAQALGEAQRVLKPAGQLVVVYAHKTTLGWATLVDALRQAGYMVTEAWPLHTEMKARLVAMDTAALASSIFLVARKRDGGNGCQPVRSTGSYEEEVQPELGQIVRERVQTLWDMGITGADLVIAAVGAGLRAFTRFARVEYANGEEVPAERFLAEVETVVLETILQRLSQEVGGRGQDYSLAGLDPASRFYLLWRYTYQYGVLEAGEAIVFANGTHVELDGPQGLSTGARALLEKSKGKYRLRDFRERGEDNKLGLSETQAKLPVPLIDVLHRVLWLMEYQPFELTAFLQEAQPNREQLRLLAQALAGPALKGGELADISPAAELAALTKLLANWKSLMEEGPLFSG